MAKEHRLRIPSQCLIAVWIFLCCFSPRAVAAPVTADSAARAAQGWLHREPRIFGKASSARFNHIEPVTNAAGSTLYFIARLNPAGYVILPADDQAGPIIAFSATGRFDPASGSPMALMINRDLPRHAAARQARQRWRALMAGSPYPPPDAGEDGNLVLPSQVWVAPFVQTLWNQTTDVSLQDACYNYYTPPGAPGASNNYPCGCVATALAQELYYFQYPNTPVGTGSYWITNNGRPKKESLLGGDGNGGVYQWADMPLSPNGPSASQAAAIGALTHDAGLAVNTSYKSGDAGVYFDLTPGALINTFKFANAAYYEDDNGISSITLANMINPNLDAHLPVILGVLPSGGNGGHCVLCDGYGYDEGTLFHHINAGYAGDDDIWYAFPDIDTIYDGRNFPLLVACTYNIFTNGYGQIISGHVTDATGAPVPGAVIAATQIGGGTFTATTDSNGIYALPRVPSAASFTLAATCAGYSSAAGGCSTGPSDDAFTGNVWGANFVLSQPLLLTSSGGFASIGPPNGPFSVTSQLCTLSNASDSPISWTLSNTNTFLTADPAAGALAAGAAANFAVSLASSAANLPAGAYSGSILAANSSNSSLQTLTFSLSVMTADYPIAVSGYNRDVVVENDAVGGDSASYAAGFDPRSVFFKGAVPVCFYESGLAAVNFDNTPSALGLPPGGLVTSELDAATTFQLGPYGSSNVLYLTRAAPSRSLTLNSPAAYQSLSILAASAQGGGNGILVIHFTDGTSSEGLPFNAANYLVTNTPGSGAALTAFGLLASGYFNEFTSCDEDEVFPTLYQTSLDLHSLGYDTKPIAFVTFSMPVPSGANMATGVFALSGTQTAYTGLCPVAVTASPAGAGVLTSGGLFAAGSTNTVTATAKNGRVFANWTLGGVVVSASPSYSFIVNGGENLAANFLLPNTEGAVNVIINGQGAIEPDPSDRILTLGQVYTLTAIPCSGSVFSNWTGDVVTNKNPFTFTLDSNMILRANFISNPFPAVRGTYNGLFSASNGVTEQSAGMVSALTVTSRGSYTGNLLINGASQPLNGAFNLEFQATNIIPRPASQGGPLTVVMSVVQSNDSAPQLTGVVSNAAWTANLTADIAGNSFPSAAYTMLLPPDAANAPGGDGYAVITNHAGPANGARIVGVLADGVPFSQTVPVSSDGRLPLYANLYGGEGLLLGWIDLGLTNQSGDGLTWIHPALSSGFYPNPFTNIFSGSQILLSPWSNAPSILDRLTNLSLLHAITNSAAITNIPVRISSAGLVGGPGVNGAVNLKTGSFKITIGSGSSRVTGTGAILLNSTNGGGGCALTGTNILAIRLTP